MFSVIIPLYNKSPYILKAIGSVLDQSFKEFELIVINDGSTDNSLEVIQQFNCSINQQIKIVDQLNQGVSVARNMGVAVAKYDFLTFLDGDDWWDPNFLEEMKDLIQEYPEAGIYGCKYFWVKNGRLKESINHLHSGFKGYIDYFKAYTHAWWMPLSSISIVVPKTVFNDLGGFKPNLKFAEDFDLWIRCALKFKIAYINKPLAYYNQDVDLAFRALGNDRIYPPSNHSIFNLSFLENDEKARPELKKLLDGLRVRALLRYHLCNKFKFETTTELNKVDFSQQSGYYRRLYSYPVSIIRFYYWILNGGSLLKQFIRKTTQIVPIFFLT